LTLSEITNSPLPPLKRGIGAVEYCVDYDG
jgi:hypothetical protein